MELMKLFQLLAAFAVVGSHGLNINYDYTDLQLADFIAMTVHTVQRTYLFDG